jgi:succinate dehydrogenase / fumarate reductase cytochrome b subunit
MTTRPRPLSPHLSIWRFTITMAMSIVHRITGGALYVGTLLLIVWLGCAAIGGGAYDGFQAVAGHWFGQLVLFGYTWALLHHALGGLRYFTWDTGTWMFSPRREQLAWANIIVSVILTLLLWALFVWFR